MRGWVAPFLAFGSWLPASFVHATPDAVFAARLAEIVDRSLAVSVRRAELAATRARGRTARLHFLPSLSLAASAERGDTAGASSESRSVVASSTLNLYRFGADGAQARAALLDEAASEARLDQAMLEAEAAGAQAMLDWLERRAEVDILARIEDQSRELLRIAMERYKRGLLPLQETQKLEVDIENVHSRRSDAEARWAAARARLEALLGAPFEPIDEWPWKSTLAQLSVADVKREGLAARPDRREASASAESAHERARRADRLRWPSLDASLSAGRYALPNSGLDYSAWNSALTLSFTLFDRLSLDAEATALARVAEARDAESERIARSSQEELETALARLTAARRTALASERSLKLSRGLYEDGLKRFKAGRIDANELAVERGRQSESELSAVRAWSETHAAWVAYCGARGLRLGLCQ